MASIIRWFTIRRKKTGTDSHKTAGFGANSSIPKKEQLACVVQLLDGTNLPITLNKKDKGSALLEKVFFNLDLLDCDYFGLKYTDHNDIQHWLDPTKKIKKQLTIGPPFTFRFRVKFYPVEPNQIKDDLTRYQLFLQLKHDILYGHIEIESPDVCAQLAALILQSESGDHDPEAGHDLGFVSEFRFIPDQTEEIEEKILQEWMSLKNINPAQAELRYCNKARNLDNYGVDTHIVEGSDGGSYTMGLTPHGILIFEGRDKIGLFSWPCICRLDFSSRKLYLTVEEQHSSNPPEQHKFIFRASSAKATKHLWKCAIEYHSFFRLVAAKSNAKSGPQGFIRLGSRFRYSGRTEIEKNLKDRYRSRPSTTPFERKPSQRFSRRTLSQNTTPTPVPPVRASKKLAPTPKDVLKISKEQERIEAREAKKSAVKTNEVVSVLVASQKAQAASPGTPPVKSPITSPVTSPPTPHASLASPISVSSQEEKKVPPVAERPKPNQVEKALRNSKIPVPAKKQSQPSQNIITTV